MMKAVLLMSVGFWLAACSGSSTPTTPETPQIAINEVMASNATGLQDQSGAFPDWIELYNDSGTDVDLSAWTLTDDPALPQKWSFPAGTTIDDGGFLIVFADGDPGLVDELHTTFRLDSSGEDLQIIGPAAADLPVVDSLTFGMQETDVSWARDPDGTGTFGPETSPTPGESNE